MPRASRRSRSSWVSASLLRRSYSLFSALFLAMGYRDCSSAASIEAGTSSVSFLSSRSRCSSERWSTFTWRPWRWRNFWPAWADDLAQPPSIISFAASRRVLSGAEATSSATAAMQFLVSARARVASRSSSTSPSERSASISFVSATVFEPTPPVNLFEWELLDMGSIVGKLKHLHHGCVECHARGGGPVKTLRDAGLPPADLHVEREARFGKPQRRVPPGSPEDAQHEAGGADR